MSTKSRCHHLVVLLNLQSRSLEGCFDEWCLAKLVLGSRYRKPTTSYTHLRHAQELMAGPERRLVRFCCEVRTCERRSLLQEMPMYIAMLTHGSFSHRHADNLRKGIKLCASCKSFRWSLRSSCNRSCDQRYKINYAQLTDVLLLFFDWYLWEEDTSYSIRTFTGVYIHGNCVGHTAYEYEYVYV